MTTEQGESLPLEVGREMGRAGIITDHQGSPAEDPGQLELIEIPLLPGQHVAADLPAEIDLVRSGYGYHPSTLIKQVGSQLPIAGPAFFGMFGRPAWNEDDKFAV